MFKSKFKWVSLLCMLAAAVTPIVHADTIKIGGTGSAQGTIKLLKEAFEQEQKGKHHLEIVPPLGSSGGIKALQARALDIAVSSRPLNENESKAGLKALSYGATPFIIAANKSVPVKSITLDQLADIFDGSSNQWANNIPVRLILRPKSDADNETLISMSKRMAESVPRAHSRPGMLYGTTDTHTADEVEKVSGAISTSSLALALSERRDFKILAINGVEPSLSAAKNGSYPYVKKIYAVTRPDASDAANQFIQFLTSERGKTILEKNGHLIEK